MSSTDDSGRKTVRERIIEDAQMRCHQARSRCYRARMIYDGEVPQEIKLALQEAIIDYYRAMRPLRDESIIRDFWEDAILSRRWIKGQRQVEQPTVDGDLHGHGVSVRTETTTETVYYRGLDVLEDLETATETERVEKTSMRGRTTEEVTRQKVLPAGVLVDIASVLDDAAAKLGFKPDTEQQRSRYGFEEIE